MGFLGDWLHYLILVVTLGQGKKISSYIALKWFGIEDCGCDSRRENMNNWLLPEHKKRYRI
jgi:hypothetical protein